MRSMRPLTGLRFTWQLNTLMKIDTRGSGAVPRPSSAGGTALTTRLTIPSAGATTMPSRTGVTRTGSRKKKAHHAVTMVAIQPSGDHTQNSTMLSTAKAPMNGKPSGWIGESCERMDLMMDNEAPYSATSTGAGIASSTGAGTASATGGGLRLGATSSSPT